MALVAINVWSAQGGMRVAGARIDITVGDMVIQAEAMPKAGSELTAGRTSKAAENVADAFHKAQDAIVQVARSTAQMITGWRWSSGCRSPPRAG
jgi:hypothetical protein